MAWYQQWFGEDYLELYSHRDSGEAEEHIELVGCLFGEKPPRAILDLACGAGRHTGALRQRGYRALGVDLSLTLLVQGRALPRVRGDMRRLPFADGSFDWVLNFFTSFGYFEGERENFQVLEEIARVLEPDGRYLLDLMNLDYALANLREYEVREVAGRRAEIHRWWDPASGRINKRILLEGPGEEPRRFLESVRAYRPEEVVIGLRWAGLEVTHQLGSFRGEPHHRDSERLILVGRRPP
jgi:SAM-dependent methyltransferase